MIKGRDDGILIGKIIRFKETAQTVQAEEKRQPVRGKAGRMGTEDGKREACRKREKRKRGEERNGGRRARGGRREEGNMRV